MLTSASNDAGIYALSYDDYSGYLTSVVNPYNVTLTIEYDEFGNRDKVIDSLGGTVTSEYNDLGQLLSRTYEASSEPELRIDYEYDDLGRIDSQTRYSDVEGTTVVATTDYEYDDEGRLIDLEHSDFG